MKAFEDLEPLFILMRRYKIKNIDIEGLKVEMEPQLEISDLKDFTETQPSINFRDDIEDL
jgi:hypothetical protein